VRPDVPIVASIEELVQDIISWTKNPLANA